MKKVEADAEKRRDIMLAFLEQNEDLFASFGLQRQPEYTNWTSSPPILYLWAPPSHNSDFTHVFVSADKTIEGNVQLFVRYQNNIDTRSDALRRTESILMNELIARFAQFQT